MSAMILVLRFVAVLALVAATTACALMYSVQRSLLFPRPDPAGMPPRPADAQQVWLEIPGARVEAWYLPPAEPAAAPAPLLLFTHGNAELIDLWPPAFDAPRSWGMGVLLIEYPGYGRSGGTPSEESITATMLAAHAWAGAQPGIDAQRLVAYGRSLGGGAACALAAQRPLAALLLESTFTSVRTFAARFFMPQFLVRDPFDNLSRVSAWHGPLLLLHGTHDEIISVTQGRALAAAAPQAEFHELPCGHNDCPRQWPLISKFLGVHDVLPKSHAG